MQRTSEYNCGAYEYEMQLSVKDHDKLMQSLFEIRAFLERLFTRYYQIASAAKFYNETMRKMKLSLAFEQKK